MCRIHQGRQVRKAGGVDKWIASSIMLRASRSSFAVFPPLVNAKVVVTHVCVRSIRVRRYCADKDEQFKSFLSQTGAAAVVGGCVMIMRIRAVLGVLLFTCKRDKVVLPVHFIDLGG